MRINSVSPSELLKDYVIRPKKTTEEQPYISDKTELTEGAKTFSTALKAAQELMDSRSAEQVSHFNDITEQIKNGTYSVSGTKVAEKILGR